MRAAALALVVAVLPVLVPSLLWPLLVASVVGLFLLLPASLPRDRAAWALGALAAGVRLALSPDRAFMHGDYPYRRFTAAWGLSQLNWSDGGGFPALMGTWWRVLGRPVDHVHGVDRLLSILTVLLLFPAVEALAGRRAALAATATLAVMPLPVAMAGTESVLVSVAFLQVAMLAGVLGGEAAAFGGALAAGMLAHTRPLQTAVALIGLALLARRGRRWALGLGAGLVGARVLEVGLGVLADGVPGSFATPRLRQVVRPMDWVHDPLIPALFDPSVTPVGLMLLAASAVLMVRRLARRDAVWVPLAALVVTTLPYLHFPLRTDWLRFSLPAQTWVAALAGLALATLPTRVAVGVGLVAAGTLGLALDPIGGPPAWEYEYRFLR